MVPSRVLTNRSEHKLKVIIF